MTGTLRVLHIASGDLWAGAEAQAFTLMSQLAQMRSTEVAAVLMNDGILADRLRSAGIVSYVLDEQKTGPIRIFAGLRAILKAWRPDVIHTHRQKENILGSIANRASRNVPSVRTIHGGNEHSHASGWRGARRRTVERLDRWCGRVLQERLIAVTRDLASQMEGEYPPGKVIVIENGVDVDAVRGRRGIAEFRLVEPDCVHIGIAGRLVEVKRVDLFIETAALLLKERPERRWRFHIFGDGPLRSRLERFSEGAGMAGIVRFHGHREDIVTCIAGLDVLLMCSDHEGMPMAALEAAALEVPTVAHAVGGMPQVVAAEFLVVRHDAHGYRDGILRALREDGRAIAKSHASKTMRDYSAKRNAEHVHSLYNELVAERNARNGTTAG